MKLPNGSALLVAGFVKIRRGRKAMHYELRPKSYDFGYGRGCFCMYDCSGRIVGRMNPMESGSSAIDLTVAVTTPENISFEYQLAGPFRRLPALLLDIAFRYLLVLAVVLVMGFVGLWQFIPGSGALMGALFLIGIFLLSWFYGLFFEAWWNGQTPGKRVFGLRVVSVDGRPINGVQATIRNLVRVADFFPYVSTLSFDAESEMFLIPTFLVALICMLMTRRFQRLGDIAAGTMVVVDEKAWYPKRISLKDPEIVVMAELIPAGFRMSSSMAKAIALYVERRNSMSKQHREDTARHLAIPLKERFGLSSEASSDFLLCALYHREFFGEPSSSVAEVVG
jgi:uncharacterized RDD family membrane protein YckC